MSSKKAKKVAVESELVPEDNDAFVSADEEEVETVKRNKKNINEAPNKEIKKVAGDVSVDEEEAKIVERNKIKINDAPNNVIKKVAGGNKRKKDVNEGNKVDGKLVSFKKLKQVTDGSELVLVDNEKEGCKYDPVKINTRMSPSHLKNVLNTCTLTLIMDLNELGLGHFHNNFEFESTPGELGMWVIKSYDHETHTLRMDDERRIKVSRELIHEILGVPIGENKVISFPSTRSEDKTTIDWRYTPSFTEDRIHITRVDDHVSSLTANESEELKSGGFGKLPILEGLEFIEPKKPKLKKKKSEVLLLGDGSMSREQELEEFKTKTSKDMKDCLNDNVSKIKALLLDTDEKLKIALNEYPEDSDLKMILGKRLGFFKELYRRDVDNAMVVLHKDNDLSEEAVKDNEVLKEKDDVPEKGNDVEKVVELGGKKTVQETSKEKDVEKVVDQNLDKTEAVKDNKVSNEIYDVHEKGKDVEKVVELDCETLEEADFPSIGLKDIESLKGAGRNLFDEKTTVQHVNEDDMILQDSLLNLPFLSTQEVSCLEIDTQKSPQIQKQAIVEKRQEDMLTKTRIFHGKETTTFYSIKSKLVKNNDGIAQCMKEKSIDEEKGKSDDFKGGHPTVKRQQIKKAMEGEKNVPKTRAKKTDAYKQDIKKPQVRKQTAAQLAKSKETKAKTVKPAPTKRKKKEPNDKEETAIHASPISFIPPTVDSESEKRQGKPSNFLVSPFYQRKVILHEPVSEEGKKIVEYIWSDNTPEG
ncbi:hypothetical protein Tco_1092079 [Tanacetum coccineum]|uniref:Uncharacterized protein n=1 Tax=Tanacetum coccineum TaxID=301880 RepID=A0ABQ5I8Y3_9ASTR